MSDFVRGAIDNVVIVIEPGNHEFAVQPMVAAHIGRLQRERTALEKLLRRALPCVEFDCFGREQDTTYNRALAAEIRAALPAPVAKERVER